MAYTTTRITVTTSPTQLDLPDGTVSKPCNFGIQNLTGSGGAVYLGGSNVATSGSTMGWEIAAGSSFSDDCVSADGAPYLVSGSSIVVTLLTEL